MRAEVLPQHNLEEQERETHLAKQRRLEREIKDLKNQIAKLSRERKQIEKFLQQEVDGIPD